MWEAKSRLVGLVLASLLQPPPLSHIIVTFSFTPLLDLARARGDLLRKSVTALLLFPKGK